jgi:hypothetical protein
MLVAALTGAIITLPAVNAEPALATSAAQEAVSDARTDAASSAVAEDPPEKPPLSLTKALGVPGVSPRLDLTAFVQDAGAGDGDGSARFTGRAAPRAGARRGARG